MPEKAARNGVMIFSRLGSRTTEIHRQLHLFQVLDLPIGRLEAGHIFRQRLHEPLGMLRRQNDPGFYLALRRAGHHIDKIDHKLRMGMRDDGQVRIFSFCHFFTDLDIQLVAGLMSVRHIKI